MISAINRADSNFCAFKAYIKKYGGLLVDFKIKIVGFLTTLYVCNIFVLQA